MIFSSFEFIIFFLFYFFLHYLLKLRLRVYLIIFGSLFFYAYWNPLYVFIPIFLALTAWFASAWINNEKIINYKRFKLFLSLVILFLPLIFFKYSEFFITGIINIKNINLNWFPNSLPIGISFITFTVIAYIIEVYKNQYPYETSFKTLLAYILFFPQLIAGPILRPHELIGQIKKPKKFSEGSFYFGFTLFTIGLIKKIFFADQIAKIIDPIWSLPAEASFYEILIAIYGFSVQIYMDFSGYIDMAVGLALILGVKLPINFNKPYLATSLIDFWRRWHITLSAWLKDFIYIPLGGSRNGYILQVRNLFITMFIGGLWHGAGWNFLIWGGLHGFILGITHFFLKFNYKLKLHNKLKIFLTFNLVTFLWIFFRSENFSDSIFIINKLVTNSQSLSNGTSINIFAFFLIIIPLVIHKYDNHALIEKNIKKISPFAILPIMFIFCILGLFLNYNNSPAFIYFDF